MSKVCSKCGQTKDLSLFSTRGKSTRNECKQCRSEYHKSYYKKNREAILEKAREHRESNPDYQKEYYRKTKEERTRWQRDYYQNNKASVIAKVNKQRLGNRKAIPEWLSDQDKASIDSVYKLSQELSNSTGVPHHVDHIVPLRGENVCGLHVYWNLQVLPSSENISKGNKYNDWD